MEELLELKKYLEAEETRYRYQYGMSSTDNVVIAVRGINLQVTKRIKDIRKKADKALKKED